MNWTRYLSAFFPFKYIYIYIACCLVFLFYLYSGLIYYGSSVKGWNKSVKVACSIAKFLAHMRLLSNVALQHSGSMRDKDVFSYPVRLVSVCFIYRLSHSCVWVIIEQYALTIGRVEMFKYHMKCSNIPLLFQSVLKEFICRKTAVHITIT